MHPNFTWTMLLTFHVTPHNIKKDLIHCNLGAGFAQFVKSIKNYDILTDIAYSLLWKIKILFLILFSSELKTFQIKGTAWYQI